MARAAAAIQSGGDSDARRRIFKNLEESLLVEAAAGTGKTTELVQRMVAVLGKGLTTIDRVVAVTFTRKAAGELKLRLRQELDKARNDASDAAEARHLEHALERLEEARIGTIHSFCAEILRERPVEARIDPAFAELNEYESPRLYGQAFRAWLQAKLAESSPGLRRCLLRLASGEDWDRRPPIEKLQDAGWNLVEWRDFPAEWRRPPFERDREIDALVEQSIALAEMSARGANARDYLRIALEPAREAAGRIQRAEAVRPRDYDALEALLLEMLRKLKRNSKRGSGHWFAEGLPRQIGRASCRERV